MVFPRRTNLRGDHNLRSPGAESTAQYLIDDVPIDLGESTEIITGDITLGAADSSVFVDASAGNIVVTLPAATSVPGKKYNIKKIDSSTNTVTILPVGSDLIDDFCGVVISDQYDNYTPQSANPNWWIL